MSAAFKPSQQQRAEEGRLLKQAFARYKDRTGNTQVALCNRIGLNPGLLHAYFKAEKPIPVPTLLLLCRELAIDPRSIRPPINDLIEELAELTTDQEILIRLASLSESQQDQVLDYVEFLRSKEPR